LICELEITIMTFRVSSCATSHIPVARYGTKSINCVLSMDVSDLAIKVFNSQEGLKLALEAYLTGSIGPGIFTMKHVASYDSEP